MPFFLIISADVPPEEVWEFIAGISKALPMLVYHDNVSLILYNVCNCGNNTLLLLSSKSVAL